MVGAVSKGYVATIVGVVAVWLRLFTASSPKLDLNTYKLKAAFPFEDFIYIHMWSLDMSNDYRVLAKLQLKVVFNHLRGTKIGMEL